MSTITPSPVWLDKLVKLFSGELSDGTTTNCLNHWSLPFRAINITSQYHNAVACGSRSTISVDGLGRRIRSHTLPRCGTDFLLLAHEFANVICLLKHNSHRHS